MTRIDNDSPGSREIVLHSTILDSKGTEISMEETRVALDAESDAEINQDFNLDQPSLWSVEQPDLYYMRTDILDGEDLIDRVFTVFGIRKIEYNATKGFLLNGKQVKMKGVCLHHDGGCVGAAVPDRVWERRLEVLKKMGCNAIRTSHNPMSPEFMYMCDRMGFLVMDEIFDEWTQGRVPHVL